MISSNAKMPSPAESGSTKSFASDQSPTVDVSSEVQVLLDMPISSGKSLLHDVERLSFWRLTHKMAKDNRQDK